MKKFVFILFLLIPIFVLTNCSQPIGNLEDSLGKTDFEGDSMWLVPKRQLYQIDERFLRNEDFQIFMVDSQKGVVSVPPTTPGVRVTLSGNHNLSTEFIQPVITTHHQFFIVGRHIVTVEYSGRSSNYSLEVFSPNNGNSIGGDGGIGIIWLE